MLAAEAMRCSNHGLSSSECEKEELGGAGELIKGRGELQRAKEPLAEQVELTRWRARARAASPATGTKDSGRRPTCQRPKNGSAIQRRGAITAVDFEMSGYEALVRLGGWARPRRLDSVGARSEPDEQF